MIVLHRLGHQAEEFLLNPDLILTVEANPDTVVTLTSGVKIVVVESPHRVAEAVRAWRVSILDGALNGRHDPPPELPREPRESVRPPLAAVEGTSSPADHQS